MSTTVAVQVRFPESLHSIVKQAAREQERPMSRQILYLIRLGIKADGRMDAKAPG